MPKKYALALANVFWRFSDTFNRSLWCGVLF